MAKPLKNVAVVALMLILGAAWSGCPKLPNMEGVGFSCAADRPCAPGWVCSCPTGGTCRPAGTAPGPSGCLDVEGSDVEADATDATEPIDSGPTEVDETDTSIDGEDGTVQSGCQFIQESYNAHDYWICTESLTWDAANKSCDDQGMDLLQPNGTEENEHWKKNAKDYFVQESTGFWLQLKASEETAEIFTDWKDDQPAEGDCIVLVKDGWVTSPCDLGGSARGYVCEERDHCGDGMVQGSEECDDGNQNDEDDCRNDCHNTWVVFGEDLLTGPNKSLGYGLPFDNVDENETKGAEDCLWITGGSSDVWVPHPVVGASRYRLGIRVWQGNANSSALWAPVSGWYVESGDKKIRRALAIEVVANAIHVSEYPDKAKQVLEEIPTGSNTGVWTDLLVEISTYEKTHKLWVDGEYQGTTGHGEGSKIFEGVESMLAGHLTCWRDFRAYYIAHECGNGITEDDEECDDGNEDDEDSCTNECVFGPGKECVDAGAHDGASYTFCEIPKSWSGAMAVCEELGLKLVQPDDPLEDSFVGSVLAGAGVGETWLRLKVATILACEPPDCEMHQNWYDGEPKEEGDCVAMEQAGWYSADCFSENAFVCEPVTCKGNPCGENEDCSTDEGIGYTCTCSEGYEYDGPSCVDIDECAADVSPCDFLETCTNNDGGFQCGDCEDGYTKNEDLDCVDIDECDEDLFPDTCEDDNETCVNNDGGYVCQCAVGFEQGEEECVDIDECLDPIVACPAQETCTNTPGGFQCDCGPGFEKGGGICEDINECAEQNGGCAKLCANTIGGFNCSCTAGYALAGDGFSCDDIDECAEALGGCVQICTNIPGGFFCSCAAGYTLVDGIGCDDIDECAEDQADCAQICTDTDGGFDCSCAVGYTLAGDGFSCDDIDECTFEPCAGGNFCVNTPGGYECQALMEDCEALLASNPALPSGNYLIDPGGPNVDPQPFVVYCDMEKDGGGWTQIASNSGNTKFDATSYAQGVNDSVEEEVLPAGDYAFPCTHWLSNADQGDIVVRMTMGNVTDFFRPKSVQVTLCAMLQSTNQHQWWNGATETWVKPDYNDNHLGGSAADWPKDFSGADPRKFLSFWGMNDATGGCCVDDYYYDDGAAGLPFTVSIKTTKDAPTDVVYGIPQVDCAEWLAVEPGLPSGAYYIDPDGLGFGKDPIQVYCDMETEGGGWTSLTDSYLSTLVPIDRKYLWTRTAPDKFWSPSVVWTESPATELVWSWSQYQALSGLYSWANEASVESSFECADDGTSGKYGIGCVNAGSFKLWTSGNGAEDDYDASVGTCLVCGQTPTDVETFCAEDVQIWERRADAYGTEDCQALLVADPELVTGYYYIDLDGPGGNNGMVVYCDMGNEGGGWTEIARNSGAQQFDVSAYTNGVAAPDPVGDPPYVLKLSDYEVLANSENIVMRMTMGSVTDFFRPLEGADFATMLLSPDHHQWWNPMIGAWVEPLFFDANLGGSAVDWPKAIDGRKHLGFWGSDSFDGGCCTAAYDYAGIDELPFSLSIKKIAGELPTVPPMVDCKAWHDAYPGLGDGEYLVDHDDDPQTLSKTVFCDMSADGGGWTEIANNTGGAKFTIDNYQNGKPTVDGSYVLPCGDWHILPNAGDTVVRVTMGAVTDFFRPIPGKSLCEMLTSSQLHQWWFNAGLKWETPAYYPEDLGGSALDWPKPRDGRKFLSFWGGPDSGYNGGCCADQYQYLDNTNLAFTVSIKTISGGDLSDLEYFGPTEVDCQAWHDKKPELPSGPYYIDPDGPGGKDPIQVHCDMTHNGGGWTQIAKNDGTVKYFIDEYQNGVLPPSETGNYAYPCDTWEALPLEQDDTIVLRVDMGNVRDFFGAYMGGEDGGGTFCTMLLNKVQRLWWAGDDYDWVYVIPYASSDKLGGSELNSEWFEGIGGLPSEKRDYLSFWGLEDANGGCCSEENAPNVATGLPFTLYMKRQGFEQPIIP